jgi:AcrR family transcriptional regulator
MYPSLVPKQTRSIETRQRLIHAAAEVLSEVGPSEFTTTAVVRRAGKSQGALFRSFATRMEILVAAFDQLLKNMLKKYQQILPSSGDLRSALKTIWQLYNSSAMCSIYEVYLMSLRNPELNRLLRPVLGNHRDHLLELARQHFPKNITSLPQFERVVCSVLSMMRGGALVPGIATNSLEEYMLFTAHDMIHRELFLKAAGSYSLATS